MLSSIHALLLNRSSIPSACNRFHTTLGASSSRLLHLRRSTDIFFQCDERKPQCSDCARHNVSCEYLYGPSTNTKTRPSAAPPTNGPYYTQPEQNGPTAQNFDPVLELRLMHEWTAYTCKTFTPTWEFWCYQAPLVALEFRYLLDAMMAMAALHTSKQPPSQWNPIEGRSGSKFYHLSQYS